MLSSLSDNDYINIQPKSPWAIITCKAHLRWYRFQSVSQSITCPFHVSQHQDRAEPCNWLAKCVRSVLHSRVTYGLGLLCPTRVCQMSLQLIYICENGVRWRHFHVAWLRRVYKNSACSRACSLTIRVSWI